MTQQTERCRVCKNPRIGYRTAAGVEKLSVFCEDHLRRHRERQRRAYRCQRTNEPKILIRSGTLEDASLEDLARAILPKLVARRSEIEAQLRDLNLQLAYMEADGLGLS